MRVGGVVMNMWDYFYQFHSVKNILNKDQVRIGPCCDAFHFMLIMTDFYKNDCSIFIVLPNLIQAQKYYDALTEYAKEEDILFFPADELISVELVATTGDFLYERIQTIYTLLKGQKKIVVMNMHGAIKLEMAKAKWEKNHFVITKNMNIELDMLVKKLIEMGYEKVFTTVKTGEFSKRGSIIDIFPLGYENPIRLDFFGDEIESIKEFDTETQRSNKETEQVMILPVTEFMYSETEWNIAKNKINSFLDQHKLSPLEEEFYEKDIFRLENHSYLNELSRYMVFFETEMCTIFDFVEKKKTYFIDPIKTKENYEQLKRDLNEYCGRIGGYSLIDLTMYADIYPFVNTADVQIEGLRSIGKIDYSICTREVLPYKANPKQIMNDFIKWKDDKVLVVAIRNEERLKRLEEYLLENHIFLNKIVGLESVKLGSINVIKQNYPALEMVDEKFILINEAVLFDVAYMPKKARYKSIYKNAIKISKYDELCVGDYVVHYDYGIGKYLGIKTIETNHTKRDFLYVMYAKGSGLYIPLEQISNIMKYASKDVEGVQIHEIGSTAWARTKARVRKRVHDISDKLIALYSARSQAKGFAFGEDTVEQAEFEAEFEYELTPDQQKAIDAIKADMESPRPMDRLVCGDVGYGKTEVALRAAFKAVYGGKQVCMLAPTTILARQHYLTFKNRMENYGIRVELLSRFVSRPKQKKIIEDLKKGGVDILIGTHRVLSDQIQYKDLGLLIVDEEQRFGVTHKEKIKEIKVNVDCITLTATPIPRTLQMSVMGIRDLSMIETPPKNRYPIQTYVMERNDLIIQDAIEREISRGGQVFYLYNFVESIETQAEKLKRLVPEARIAVGHGRLSKDQLENVISKFIDKEYDVLLCTTIIETGIDMPDTNTLIIHDADRLGLSQMYQIRGRVGRSNKIAYAYLMYEPKKHLTEEAEKRLETIKEFNELGSGFKIAMRDLSIRGAGDILGEEQSGFLESVGLDMYLKILDEEIHKKISEEKKEDASLVVPLVNRTIQPSYIDNDDIRISIHKKIDHLESLEQMKDLIAELEDRFGKVNEEMILYMYDKILKVFCKKLGICKIDKSNPRYLGFMFEKEKKVDGIKLFIALEKYKNISLTHKDMTTGILLEIQGRDKIDYFRDICQYMNEIL